MKEAVWKLRLLGEFELLDPHGQAVVLSPRKVQGLIAILTFAGGVGMSRTSLQQALWPEVGMQRQQMNLRQAIVRLRRAIGPTLVVSTRDACRISEAMRIECDAISSPGIHGEAAFMPDHPEPWFRDVRESRQCRVGGLGLSSAAPPLESFWQLLRWSCDQDPVRVVEMMRANLDLTSGLTAAQYGELVDPVLRVMRPNHPLFGWTMLFKGMHVMYSVDLSSSRRWLQQAVELAQGTADVVLEAEAIYNLGLAEIVMARVEVAKKLSDRANVLAAKSGSRILAGRATDLAAHVQIHRGNMAEGLLGLQAAGDLYQDDNLRVISNDALRALYYAISGNLKAAELLLTGPEQFVHSTGHSGLSFLCLMTRGTMALKAREFDLAIGYFEDLFARATRSKDVHFEIYCQEALASAAWQLKDRGEATAKLKSSNRLRQQLGMRVTEWDRQRLSELPLVK